MNLTINRPAGAEIAGSPRGALPTFVVWSAVAIQAVLAPVTLGTAAVLSEYYDVPTFGWSVIAIYLLWPVAVVVLVVTARRRPLATPLIPAANVALMVSLVTFGINVLGWSA